MRTVWHVARTDLLRWLRSPGLVAATLIPAGGMVLMAVALTYAVGRQPVALVSESHGKASATIESLIRKSDGFFLVTKTATAARRDLDVQKVAAIITIPRGFDDKAAGGGGATVDVLINNVDLDFSDDIRRSVAEAVVAYNIDAGKTLAADEAAERGGAPPDLPAFDRSAILGSHFRVNPYGVSADEFDLRHPDVSFLSYQLVPVLALVALTGGALVTALALAGEREMGLLDLMKASSASRTGVIVGHLAGGAVAAVGMLAALIVPLAVAGVLHPPPGRWPLVAAILLLTAVASTALGVVIGVACRTPATAVLLGVNVVAASFLLGGGFTTVAFLPTAVQRLARLTPTFYSVDALREALFYRQLTATGYDLAWLAVGTVTAVVVATALLFWTRGRRHPARAASLHDADAALLLATDSAPALTLDDR